MFFQRFPIFDELILLRKATDNRLEYLFWRQWAITRAAQINENVRVSELASEALCHHMGQLVLPMPPMPRIAATAGRPCAMA